MKSPRVYKTFLHLQINVPVVVAMDPVLHTTFVHATLVGQVRPVTLQFVPMLAFMALARPLILVHVAPSGKEPSVMYPFVRLVVSKATVLLPTIVRVTLVGLELLVMEASVQRHLAFTVPVRHQMYVLATQAGKEYHATSVSLFTF